MHTESIENICKEMRQFSGYEDMSPAEQLAIAEDVKHEIETYDVFLDEYLTFRFDTLTQEERRKYLPTSEFVWRLPENVNREMYSGKYELYNKAKRFISREHLCLEDASEGDFMRFFGRHKKIIAKPLHEQCGTGIAAYRTADWEPDALYRTLIANGTPLAEECVAQHPDMAKFHPESVNTLRIVTFADLDGHLAMTIGGARFGVGDSVCDNVARGGIWVPVDMTAGRIAGDGVDNTCHHYERHPDTGIVFKNSAIPCFDRVTQLLDEYVKLFPETRFQGWDIAIKADGEPELIEVNSRPDLTPEQLWYGPLAEPFRKLYGTKEYRCQ